MFGQPESQGDECVLRSLFGGAMQFTIPRRFADVSGFRQVPDNQEVFTDVHTDQSIIIELLSMEEVSHEESAAHHFKELARDNDAMNDSVVIHNERLGRDDVPNLGDDVFKAVLVGQQRISKFNETAKNVITIFLATIRLANVKTDVSITFNVPVQISAASSSASNVGPLSSQQMNSLAVLKALLKSFAVRDWSLFASD